MSYQFGIDMELFCIFVVIVEYGGFICVVEVVNCIQLVVSMQMKWFEEDVLQCLLFECDGRQICFIVEGQVLFGYVWWIFKLYGEVFNILCCLYMVGLVCIGILDDYVMCFFLVILLCFVEVYLLVQVEVYCDILFNLLVCNDFDLFIVICELGIEIGQLLCQEFFVWMVVEGFCFYDQWLILLVMFNIICFCWVWVCNVLEVVELDYCIVYSSFSLLVLFVVVSVGFVVIV